MSRGGLLLRHAKKQEIPCFRPGRLRWLVSRGRITAKSPLAAL